MPTIPVPSRARREASDRPADPARLQLADAALLVAFAGLAFLLGVFPLKDVDFWWHLRTGDLIRQTGEVPRTDPYSYTVPDHSWIDLHWGFQLLLSLGFELGERIGGGIVLLNLAKCAITTVAVLLLVTARRREWPLWAMVTTWLPALVLLGGRMYIRPETLTLLYIAVFLAVLFRWERWPWLGFLLPVTQALWVNTQGLFIFGPILLGFALIDAALRPGAFATDRRGWWRVALAVVVLDGLACLLNPYGLRGALFPLTDLLFGTLNDPIFKETIAELSSIPRLIEESAGYPHFMLIVHLSVVLLGGLSFVLPMLWQGTVRIAAFRAGSVEPGEDNRPKGKGKRGRAATATAGKRRAKGTPPDPGPSWSLRPFRLLLYLAFTALSWQATRNSHQFAAIVGTVTAWNFGEWAAAVRDRRAERGGPASPRLWPSLAALGATAAMIVAVATGGLYAAAEEGRTVGLGEEPAWFPHRAVEFAGSPGLPPRFVGFHIGHNALFIYHHGPDRKVFADPRLEVMGPDQYREYIALREAIAGDDRRSPWRSTLERAGNPVVLTDHDFNAAVGASLMLDPSWRCIWFDEVAAVFAHEPDARDGGFPAVDFLGRHFGTQADPAPPTTGPEWQAAVKGMSKYVLVFLEQRGRPDQARALIPLGLDRAREARRVEPGSAEPWALAAAMELGRIDMVSAGPDRRYLLPFDPTEDLHPARVAAFARRALDRDPDQSIALSALLGLAMQRGMDEVAVPLLERAVAQAPRSPRQAESRDLFREQLDRIRVRLGRAPRVDATNGDRIRRSVDALLASGRVESAVALLEQQYPPGERDWPTADRIATLLMHLGRPDRAREAWRSVASPPDAALRRARVAASYYAEDDLDGARDAYRFALADAPGSFEALYGLALVEHDAGRAVAALDAARSALDAAPDDASRIDAQAIIRRVEPYATTVDQPR